MKMILKFDFLKCGVYSFQKYMVQYSIKVKDTDNWCQR